MTTAPTRRPRLLPLLAAFASGGLLTLMVHFNGELSRYGSPFFASWAAHATGTVAAALMLLALLPRRGPRSEDKPAAPLWAYAGGLSGAATVMLSAFTVNGPLALSGTLALSLAGQVLFGLAADRWGLFGLPARRLTVSRDGAALALILVGSALIILFGRVPA